jgi:hypothetical protein
MGVGAKRSKNTFEIGPLSNLPRRTNWGFSYYDNVAAHYATDLQYPARSQAYSGMSVYYSEGLQGFILDPWSNGSVVQNMALSQWNTNGPWAVVRPKGQAFNANYLGVPPVVFNVSAESKYTLPEGACFFVAIQRAESRPLDESGPIWYSISFGKQFTLLFGGMTGPTLTREESSNLPYKQWHYRLTPDKAADYYSRTDMLWEFYQVGPDLLIVSNILGEWWVRDVMGVYDIDKRPTPIRAGAVGIAAGCGGFAFNLVQPYFASSGQFTIDLDFGATYDSEALDAHALPWQLSSTLDCEYEVITEDGTKKTLRWTLPSDGTRTPIMQAWQVIAHPTFTEPEEVWHDASGYVIEARESLGDGLRSHECEVTFDNHDSAFALWLETLDPIDGTYLSGDLAFRYSIGYVDDNDVEHVQQRMVGILKRRSESSPVSGADRYTITAYNKAVLLAETTLINCPCLVGFVVADAIRVLCEWSDIPPTDVVFDHEMDAAWKVDDPGRNYHEPNWHIEDGANALEILERFLSTHGLYGRFGGDGKLHVGILTRQEKTSPPEREFTTQQGGLSQLAIKDITADRSLVDVPNSVIAVGEIDGERVQFALKDDDGINTPGSDRYQGKEVVKWIDSRDITSMGTLILAAAGEYYKLQRGCEIELTGYAELQLLRDGEVIGITDTHTAAGGKNFRVTSVSTTLRNTVNEPTARAREIVEVT